MSIDPAPFSPDALRRQLARDGIVGPFRVCRADVALRLADRFLRVARELDERLAAATTGPASETARRQAFLQTRNRHLYDRAVCALVHSPALTARLAAAAGSPPVVWRTQAFVIHARNAAGGIAPLPWHRDNYATLLAAPRITFSVHVALSQAAAGNCMRALVGSHHLTDEDLARRYGLDHIEGSERHGPGTSRYDGDVPPHATALRHLVMEPGEAYLFTDRLVHASYRTGEPRAAGGVRVGFAIRATTANVHILPQAFAESLPRRDRPIRLE